MAEQIYCQNNEQRTDTVITDGSNQEVLNDIGTYIGHSLNAGDFGQPYRQASTIEIGEGEPCLTHDTHFTWVGADEHYKVDVVTGPREAKVTVSYNTDGEGTFDLKCRGLPGQSAYNHKVEDSSCEGDIGEVSCEELEDTIEATLANADEALETVRHKELNTAAGVGGGFLAALGFLFMLGYVTERRKK